jgi:intracellular septation protein
MAAEHASRRVDIRRLAARFASEFGPVLVFAVSIQWAGLAAATALFIAATTVSAVFSWYRHRRFPHVPAGMAVLAALFGGLTLVFGQAAFIEVRATVVNAAAAVAIVAGLATGRLVLKRSLQDGFQLPDPAWRTLSIRTAVYLAFMALLNEAVRYRFETEVWAWFKAAAPVMNAAFLAANWPFIRAHLADGGRCQGEPARRCPPRR